MADVLEVEDVPAMLLGDSLTFRAPDEWVIDNGLDLGDRVYCIPHSNGTIEYRKEDHPLATALTLRAWCYKYPTLTIPAQMARSRGIKRFDRVQRMVVGTDLVIWKDPE